MSKPTDADRKFMALARDEAAKGLAQAGVPVGSVLVRAGVVLAAGHNQRVQLGDPIAHGEMDCMRNAGRQKTYKDTVLYTTLSPCMMCSGTILQFGIPRLVIGENTTFGGNESLLEERGVEVVVLDDPKCKELMDTFIESYPTVWAEDIGEAWALTTERTALRLTAKTLWGGFRTRPLRARFAPLSVAPAQGFIALYRIAAAPIFALLPQRRSIKGA